MRHVPRWKIIIGRSTAGHRFKSAELERFFTKEENKALGMAPAFGYRLIGALSGMTEEDIQILSDDLDKTLIEVPEGVEGV